MLYNEQTTGRIAYGLLPHTKNISVHGVPFQLVLVLAALVAHRAGSLARGLAGSLALAASALLYRVLQSLCIQCLYGFHIDLPFRSFI